MQIKQIWQINVWVNGPNGKEHEPSSVPLRVWWVEGEEHVFVMRVGMVQQQAFAWVATKTFVIAWMYVRWTHTGRGWYICIMCSICMGQELVPPYTIIQYVCNMYSLNN